MAGFVPAAAGVLALALAVSRVRASRRLRAVPHFSGNRPLLGCAKAIQQASDGKLHHVWEQLVDEANKKGEPVIQLSYLTARVVLLASPEAAEVVLKQKFVPKSNQSYRSFRFMGCKADPIVALTAQEEHARLRKEFSLFFGSANMEKVLARLTREVARSCDEVTAQARAGGGSVTVEMLEMANELIDSIVQHVFFEVDNEHKLDVRPFFDTLRHMGEVNISELKVMLITHGLHPGFFRFRRNWHATRKIWATLMKQAYARPLPDFATAEEQGVPFWVCLRRAFPDAMQDEKQYEDCMANFMLAFGAGIETTAGAMGMTLAMLALDSDAMLRFELELEENGLLASADNPTPRAPTASELAQLPHLNAILHEGLRVCPPAPTGTLRRLAQDTNVCGTMLPKGTIIDVSPWGLHYSKAAWGEDAKQWRPERWLEGRSVNAVKRTPTGAIRWLPFSDGRQNCVGQQLATMELRLGLAMFVSRFRVEVDTDRMPRCTSADAFAADCSVFTTLRRSEGVYLRMTPRASA